MYYLPFSSVKRVIIQQRVVPAKGNTEVVFHVFVGNRYFMHGTAARWQVDRYCVVKRPDSQEYYLRSAASNCFIIFRSISLRDPLKHFSVGMRSSVRREL